MNALDVMKYGNLTLLGSLKDLDQRHWTRPNVCGVWSVKDIIAHLASYEAVLVEALEWLLDNSKPLSIVARFGDGQAFNDAEVGRRKDLPAGEVLGEYQSHHARAMALLEHVPPDLRRRKGALAWYGAEYDLEDMLAYAFYGHKREHSAQINVFKDLLTAEGEPLA